MLTNNLRSERAMLPPSCLPCTNKQALGEEAYQVAVAGVFTG